MEEQKNIKRRLSLKVVILLLGCVHVATPKSRGKEPLTNEERKKFLVAHNNYRADPTKELEGVKQPKAANMRRMYWSSGLEADALAWSSNQADKNQMAHGHSKVKELEEVAKMLKNTENKGFGQNIAAGAEDPITIVGNWYSEMKHYTLKTLTCSKESCLHYTQIMWADSYFLGCGLVQKEGKAQYSTCNYYTRGNYAGDSPYKEGDNCSLCSNQTKPDFTSCEGGLCQPKDKCSPVTECKVVDMENCLCSEADYNVVVTRLLKANGLRLAPSSLLLLLSVVVGGLLISPIDIA